MTSPSGPLPSGACAGIGKERLCPQNNRMKPFTELCSACSLPTRELLLLCSSANAYLKRPELSASAHVAAWQGKKDKH